MTSKCNDYSSRNEQTWQAADRITLDRSQFNRFSFNGYSIANNFPRKCWHLWRNRFLPPKSSNLGWASPIYDFKYIVYLLFLSKKIIFAKVKYKNTTYATYKSNILFMLLQNCIISPVYSHIKNIIMYQSEKAYYKLIYGTL